MAALPCIETVGVPQQGKAHGCGARNEGGDCIGFRRQQESLPFLQQAIPVIPSVAASATTGTTCAKTNTNNSHAAVTRRRMDLKICPVAVIPLGFTRVCGISPGVKRAL
jgi:hypothetical protein